MRSKRLVRLRVRRVPRPIASNSHLSHLSHLSRLFLTQSTGASEPEHEDDVLSDDEPSVSNIDSNDSDGDGGASDDDSDVRGPRGRKFVMPPPREALPERTTRGMRVGALAVPEDDDADNEFWNQEFFAEEAADERYETESEPEDRFDQDFNDSEDQDDDEEEVEELEDRTDFDGTKRKVLKPPGSKKAPVRKKTAASGPSSPKPPKKPKILPERTMSVRSSTKEKVEQARAERRVLEETKGKRAYRRADHKQLTQAELLAEAARTAIENTRSLLYMEAVEEENKRRASSNSGKYVGPMVSFASSKGEDGMEHSVLRIKHMSTAPEYLQPKVLPAPVKKDICPITKTVAKYRDPRTGTPYSTVEAFRKIRAKAGR